MAMSIPQALSQLADAVEAQTVRHVEAEIASVGSAHEVTSNLRSVFQREERSMRKINNLWRDLVPTSDLKNT